MGGGLVWWGDGRWFGGEGYGWGFGVVGYGRGFGVVEDKGMSFNSYPTTVAHIKLCGRPGEEDNMMCAHNVNFYSVIK